jgi:hypothetical protein
LSLASRRVSSHAATRNASASCRVSSRAMTRIAFRNSGSCASRACHVATSAPKVRHRIAPNKHSTMGNVVSICYEYVAANDKVETARAAAGKGSSQAPPPIARGGSASLLSAHSLRAPPRSHHDAPCPPLAEPARTRVVSGCPARSLPDGPIVVSRRAVFGAVGSRSHDRGGAGQAFALTRNDGLGRASCACIQPNPRPARSRVERKVSFARARHTA